MAKNPPANTGQMGQSLGREDLLEKEMATHTSILAWEIPWTEEPGGQQSVHACQVSSVSSSSATPWAVAGQAPLSMGILQPRILEWVAVPSSRGSSPLRDRTRIFHVFCVGRGVLCY